MADLSTYKVDLETSRPNPNNPLEVRKGDAPRTAFAKYNALVELLGEALDGATVIGATPPEITLPYVTWIDTSESPARIKRRNADDTAWVTLGEALQTAGANTQNPALPDAYGVGSYVLAAPRKGNPILSNSIVPGSLLSTIRLEANTYIAVSYYGFDEFGDQFPSSNPTPLPGTWRAMGDVVESIGYYGNGNNVDLAYMNPALFMRIA